MVDFGFLPQNFWEVVGTLAFYEHRFRGGDTMRWQGRLKPYLMQKNLFEFFALTGDGDAKLWAQTLASSRAWARIIAPEPPGGISTNF